MKRILIVGRGSSGKSTLALALSKKLNLPVYHLDQYFWKENWDPVDDEEKHRLHTELISKDRWIIEGSSQFLEERAKRADHLILLDLPPYRTIPSWLNRIWKYRGTTRPDMAKGNIEKFNIEYIKWLFDGDSPKRKLKTFKEKTPHKELVILNSRRQAKKYLSSISQNS